jgi:pimeloyl-ACP methyl ester carboxylesterase
MHMQDDFPLLMSTPYNHGVRQFPDREIVSREHDFSRTTYGETDDRIRRLATALDTRLGVGRGDPIGTFAWNNRRHHELFWATANTGRICHTLNIRLFADQLIYIINHGGDTAIFVDPDLVPLLHALGDKLESVEHFVVLGEDADDSGLPGAIAYEELIDGVEPHGAWPLLDERYAVLSWDKPGSGQSTGEFDEEYGKTQRATILADAIALLGEHPAVDPDRIGLWGLSEAGWVMPIALTMTDDIAFMIVVSGGGEDSIDQGVYQWTQQARCRGASDEEIAIMEQHGAPALKAATYVEYREAMDALLTIPNLDIYIGVAIEMQEEDDWGSWPRDIDAFFNPMEVIEHTTIPVLAIFGEHDTRVDPIQGAEAYQAALERAGNTEFHVEVIPDVGHTLTPSKSDGCVTGSGGYAPRYLELIDEWIERLQTP